MECDIQAFIDKANLLGLEIKDIPGSKNHKCKLISLSDTEHIVIIPDNVTTFYRNKIEHYGISNFTHTIQRLRGIIRVVGGHKIKTARKMFSNCKASYIDLQLLDTSKVTDMHGMFSECKAEYIDTSYFDTSKVTDMSCMFHGCEAKSIDLSSFDTSNVADMHSMFFLCQAEHLDLSSFDTSNVTDMNSMFWHCGAKSIDLTSFNIKNVINKEDMFYECHAEIKATDEEILFQSIIYSIDSSNYINRLL